MPSRRDILKHTAAAGIAAAAPVQFACSAEEKVVPLPSIKPNRAPRVKGVIRREEAVVRHDGDGDNWHMSWASDDRQYVSLCDGAGFLEPFKSSYNSRMLAIEGGPRDATFRDLPGYPTLAAPTQGRKDPRYYNFGTLALDGHLYQFMSTFNRPLRLDESENPDLNNVLRFNGAKLIYSPDSGNTWHNQDGSMPVVWESWNNRSRETMVFFEEDQEAFSLLSVLQMGKNYEHNRDGYIYVYAPNGNTEGTMNELVMFRVAKGKLLDRKSYEYFSGRTSNGGAEWSKDIQVRAVVHTFPRGGVNSLLHPYAWNPSVVYNAPLGLYLMANWATGIAPGSLWWFSKPSYLGFWVASNPWGPWTQIHEETAWLPAGDKSALAFQPQIAPKWIAADGKSFWLVWSDYQVTDAKAFKQEGQNYQWNADPYKESAAAVMRATLRRKYMPYYAFNTQRVDLVLA